MPRADGPARKGDRHEKITQCMDNNLLRDVRRGGSLCNAECLGSVDWIRETGADSVEQRQGLFLPGQ